ncbi:MAG: hypothetical protein AAFY03_13525, partial [Pseudomonadota bacterium]
MARLRTGLLLILILAALPARAERPLNGAEFEAYTKGRTLYFFNNGRAYGVERYMSGRRVQWSFLDGECKDGMWYEAGEFICFVYEDNSDPQCWTFFRTPSGLRAMFENDPEATNLYEAGDSE